MGNAEALLDDALVLFEAGRFPRAHALATLACEELAKSHHCLYAMWTPCSPKWFWARFNDHEVKLESSQFSTVLASGDLSSERVVSGRVRDGSRSTHVRKLRALYVDFRDGVIQVPTEISQREALEMINEAGIEIGRLKESWPIRVANIQQWSRLPELAAAVYIVFIGWVIVTYHDIALSVLRTHDWNPSMAELLVEFREHVERIGFDACLREVAGRLSLPPRQRASPYRTRPDTRRWIRSP
jgi:AbiV family abortive infection protein